MFRVCSDKTAWGMQEQKDKTRRRKAARDAMAPAQKKGFHTSYRTLDPGMAKFSPDLILIFCGR